MKLLQNLNFKNLSIFFWAVILPCMVYAEPIFKQKEDVNVNLVVFLSIMKGVVGLLIVLSVMVGLWFGIRAFTGQIEQPSYGASYGEENNVSGSNKKWSGIALISAILLGFVYLTLDRIYLVITNP